MLGVYSVKVTTFFFFSYAKIAVTASSPIVPFRETVILPPKVDAVNEAITDLNQRMKMGDDMEEDEEVLPTRAVRVQTPNELCILQVRACPLPPGVVLLLEENAAMLKTLDQYFTARFSDRMENQNLGKLNQEMCESLLDLRNKLEGLFKEAGKKWKGAIDQIWAFGPKGNGPNILLNRVAGYERQSIWSCLEKREDVPLRPFDNCLISGFQMATMAGPLCQEPMLGVCFIVEDWHMDASLTRQRQQSESAEAENISLSLDPDSSNLEVSLQDTDDDNQDNSDNEQESVTVISNNDSANGGHKDLCNNGLGNGVTESKSIQSSESSKSVSLESGNGSKVSSKRDVYGPFSGQLMSTSKYAFLKSFQVQPQRLMVAMYTCVIQATAEILGKLSSTKVNLGIGLANRIHTYLDPFTAKINVYFAFNSLRRPGRF